MRVRSLIPLAIFLGIALLLGVGLTLDADRVPSPLIDKPVPAFELPAVRDNGRTVQPADFEGRVWLLNVWGTWCAGCREEHDTLLKAAREHDLTIVGLNYKDDRDKAVAWLERLGDPYAVSAYDPDGKVGLDLGVYGAPETYIVDGDGIIRYKHIGPISDEDLRETILPRAREVAS